MFKVTSSISEERGNVVTLEGRLADGSVEEFTRVVLDVEARLGGRLLTVDLSGVTFLDMRGASVLWMLASRGARLVGGSPFVATIVTGSTS